MSFLEDITARIAEEEKGHFLRFSPERFPLRDRKGPADAVRRLGEGFSFIAEIKKRSPSKGLLREDHDPAAMAIAYERAGASAISVITERNFFSGEKEHLGLARAGVGLPVLRKDFLLHPYQVYESYNMGADLVLLIAACHPLGSLKAMFAAVEALGLEALVEVHSEEELERALEIGPRIVGINNRNLETFEVDFRTSLRLKKRIPSRIRVISESGIDSPGKIRTLKDEGFSGALVGEYLLRRQDVGAALEELRNG